VHPCWTLENAQQIIKRAVDDAHIVLIGTGFTSTTIVEALVKRGGSLTIIEMEDRLIPRMMDNKGADIIRQWSEARGVTIKTSARVDTIRQSGERLTVSFSGEDPIEADLVISATGVAPNINFLQDSGIKTDLGVLVDEYLTTSDPNIYAAGDVAQAPDLLSDGKTVTAVQPVAAEHGRLAGINMVKGNTLAWSGSINMNVLDMLGLVSCSFGLWEGVDGGEQAELHNPEQNKYIKLQFDEDRLVSASSVGYADHVGVFQGLIMCKVALGEWKDKLIQDPTQIMKAWIGSTQRTI
jgi:NAD(P)H-nitrite reductase large subunit